MNWNLDPPAGFQGLHSDKPVTFRQRHLPHWRQAGATYMVTFRLSDALPQSKLRLLKSIRKEWEHNNPPPQNGLQWNELWRKTFQCIDIWLDEGGGSCLLRNMEIRKFFKMRCITSMEIAMNLVVTSSCPTMCMSLSNHSINPNLFCQKLLIAGKVSAVTKLVNCELLKKHSGKTKVMIALSVMKNICGEQFKISDAIPSRRNWKHRSMISGFQKSGKRLVGNSRINGIDREFKSSNKIYACVRQAGSLSNWRKFQIMATLSRRYYGSKACCHDFGVRWLLWGKWVCRVPNSFPSQHCRQPVCRSA